MTVVQSIKVCTLILGLSTFAFTGYAAAESERGEAAREIITGIFGQIVTGALQGEQGQEETEGYGEEESGEGGSDWED